MSEAAFCNLCGALEGTFHRQWTEKPELECPHVIAGKRHEKEDDEWAHVPVVRFGEYGYVVVGLHRPCGRFVEEGGVCGCTPTLEERSWARGLVTYEDGGFGPLTYKHPEANRERTAATDSIDLRCTFCNRRVQSKRASCQSCGYRGDR